MPEQLDSELQEFRDLMEVPSTFEDGFRWSSLLGAIFVALLMVPGSIYMGLLAGPNQMGEAAKWVTVILFIEVAKRAHKTLSKSEIFVLFFMAAAAMNMPFTGLLWNQYFARSDAAVSAGVAEHLPTWFAPRPDSSSYAERTFFHSDWLPVIGLIVFGTFFGQIKNLILGYGLFRVASDMERLPFPMAPIGVQGIMALAEDADKKTAANEEENWRWRIFSIGGAIGLAFGSIYLLLPTLTGALTGQPVQIFPIPFSDFTTKTEHILPAVATGMVWDLGNLIFGMVLPFWGMLGSFIGLVTTFVLNPILYKCDLIYSWEPGDNTVTTLFKNNVNFYFSFQIGIALAIAAAGIYKVFQSLHRARAKKAEESRQDEVLTVPRDRGDIPTWVVVACYFIVTLTYIGVSGYLIEWHTGVMVVLFALGFIYTPLISYVTARLEGMVGQVVEVPFIREASMILSGYRGVACWFLPVPIANYGIMTVMYRQCELTGTKFTSLWKTKFFLYPIILTSSIVFMSFIWGLADVPSAVYPNAQMMWPLRANNACIMYSATLGEFSIFEKAFSGWYVFAGTAFALALFAGMSALAAPALLTYGVVRGLGQTMPHSVLPQFIGALLGHFYFRRRWGKNWRKYIPVIAAGYACGMGLITTVGVGITFLSKSVVQLPF